MWIFCLNLCSWGSGECSWLCLPVASMLFITSSDSYNSRLVCTGGGCPRNTAHLLPVFVCVCVRETQTAIIKSCWKLSWLIEALRQPGPCCLLHLFSSLFSVLILARLLNISDLILCFLHLRHSLTLHPSEFSSSKPVFPSTTLLFLSKTTSTLLSSILVFLGHGIEVSILQSCPF